MHYVCHFCYWSSHPIGFTLPLAAHASSYFIPPRMFFGIILNDVVNVSLVILSFAYRSLRALGVCSICSMHGGLRFYDNGRISGFVMN